MKRSIIYRMKWSERGHRNLCLPKLNINNTTNVLINFSVIKVENDCVCVIYGILLMFGGARIGLY
ncbi:MAG: hypothetical protein Hyperionvirus5_47 [Hyperionvirus sp.]|uniref:Uncharacterized protein n=1 Tax=Hyperionvirus sp. TaxID=2487770 RepID=A0A3G5AAL6_9VIRU|nr:MAG: hypothetical protein Hyperionvirus5_47 [Hyperionvirus sp.]